jgi:hypothetical protein
MMLDRLRDEWSSIRARVATIGVLAAIGVVGWWLWPQPDAVTPPLPAPIKVLADGRPNPLADAEFNSGTYFPLPDEGEPLPGRPAEPMPVPRMIYGNVRLTIDGQAVEHEPVHLVGGMTVHVAGVIFGRPELPQYIVIGAGLGLVSRAENERGWIVRWDRYFGAHCSASSEDPDVACSRFEGNYAVPAEPGEYVLVVLSDAHLMGSSHPILIAAAYDAVIE